MAETLQIDTCCDDSIGANDSEDELCNPPRGPTEKGALDAYELAANRFLELCERTPQGIDFPLRHALVEEIASLQIVGSGADCCTLKRQTVCQALETALWFSDARPFTVERAVEQLKFYSCAPE